MSIPRPSERPSFGQRDAYRDVLSEGYAQGRLDDAAFRRRVDDATAATSLRSLEKLIADLPRGDLPVPAAQIRAVARREASTTRQASSARSALAVVAVVLVGGAGGFLAGGFAVQARAADSVAVDTLSDDGTESDESGEEPPAGVHGELGYGDVMRAAELASDHGELSRLTVSGTMASVHVPTEADTTYDIVSVHEDGRVTTDPGGTYGESDSDARFDGSTIDPETFAAMVLAAPDVYAMTTGNTAHATETLDFHAPSTRIEYAGVDPEAPVVTVRLGRDEYGGGGGTVIWSADGARVLEVIE